MTSRYQNVVETNRSHLEYAAVADREPSRVAESVALNAIAIAPYEYLPRDYDPRTMTLVVFLKVCERLGIPREQWPQTDILVLPPEQMLFQPPPFQLPQVDLLRPQEWIKKANEAWKKYVKGQKNSVEGLQPRPWWNRGGLALRGPKRRIPTIDLACEWAVRHLYRRESWLAISKSQSMYTLEQIKKNGRAILKAVQ